MGQSRVLTYLTVNTLGFYTRFALFCKKEEEEEKKMKRTGIQSSNVFWVTEYDNFSKHCQDKKTSSTLADK